LEARVGKDHPLRTTFSKNRERLLEGDVATKLPSAVLAQPRVKRFRLWKSASWFRLPPEPFLGSSAEARPLGRKLFTRGPPRNG
jgi:hypothetical protein